MANRVIVAGGGASGLAAAVSAAESGAKVTILEHRDRVGKKILMTGNGRCNLTNMSDVRGKYYSTDSESLDRIYAAIDRFDAAKTRDFFRSLGLCTKEKRDGGVYPASEQASIVLDVLRSACDRLGVSVWTDCELAAVRPDQTGGTVSIVQTVCAGGARSGKAGMAKERTNKTLRYDKLILAMGGKAASVAGSDGSGYQLARKLGHHLIEPLPALVQLRCEGDFFKALSGVRAQGRIVLLIDGVETAGDEGELQMTDYGISGIPVFQISRIASRALYEGRQCEAVMNFLSYADGTGSRYTAESIRAFSHKTVEAFLAGMVHKKLAAVVCRQCGLASDQTVGQAGARRVMDCIDMLTQFRVRITAPNAFEHAQVCCGGVPLREVDENFASLKCRDLYIIGELLDCDGICGGYNLQWAWTTGAIAGAAAALSR